MKITDERPLPSYAWPGGYPIYYMDTDNSVLCPKCANESLASENENMRPVAMDVNYEDSGLYCDECSKRIESAYAEEASAD
jgi:hypothetical protein